MAKKLKNKNNIKKFWAALLKELKRNKFKKIDQRTNQLSATGPDTYSTKDMKSFLSKLTGLKVEKGTLWHQEDWICYSINREDFYQIEFNYKKDGKFYIKMDEA